MKGLLLYDILLIALGVLVPAGILAGPRLAKWHRTRKEARLALEKKRDETLSRVLIVLEEVQKDQRTMANDVRCLYGAQLSQLDASEVSLLALHGEKINGNVGDAITAVRKEKEALRKRMLEKVCADIGQAD